MKYEDAIAFIEECNNFGIVPGLDSVTALADKMGNPQDSLQFVLPDKPITYVIFPPKCLHLHITLQCKSFER